MAKKKKGWLTFKSAGALFVLSAIPELFSLTSQVPLAGHIFSGVAAAVYHLGYFSLYLFLGIGLWSGKQWGYRLVIAGTGIYTLDKILFLLYRKSTEKWMLEQLNRYGGIGRMIDQKMLDQAIVLMIVVVVAGWWMFLLYTYLRRDYFRPAIDQNPPELEL